MFLQNNIVFIGNSVTEHSKSVKHLNKRVINIDSFNDDDLVGENFINPDPCGLVNKDVISILKKLRLNKDDTLIIVSSDYGRDQNYYKLLQSFGKIIGNSYEAILKIQNQKDFTHKLRKNNINFPERFFSKDQIIEPVLIKNTYLSGGLGVKKYKNDYKLNNKDEYFEKFLEGQEYSVLFISNNQKEFKIVGVNKIYNKKTSYTDFCFSGACSNIILNEKQINYLNHMVNFFVHEYSLVGINGIDFIISKDIYFLEINPRITQTCFLYDDKFNNGYVEAHINSILDKNSSLNMSNSTETKFFENLFTKIHFNMNVDLNKFSFVSNIPQLDASIKPGEPICTINSKSDNEKKAKNLLLDNISLIKAELKNIEII